MLRAPLLRAASASRAAARGLQHRPFLLRARHASFPLNVPSISSSPFFRSYSAGAAAAASRLSSLRDDADAHPSDALRQYRLLRALARVDPAAVVARVDSGAFARNAAVDMEYRHAKQALMAQQAQLQAQQHAAQQQAYAHSAPYAASSPHPPSSHFSLPPGVGTKENPLILHTAPTRIPWVESLGAALPKAAIYLAVLGAVLLLLDAMRNKSGGGGVLGMGNKVDFLSREMSHVRFGDVLGCDEAKAELQEVVEYLKNPAKFERLGAKMTKGVLLTGAPGTGKTLLAKAVAGEAGVPFFAASGSQFDEMFVGVGASRIRDLFAAARKQKRAIIFIDEIDAVGGSRDRIQGAHGRGTINALLTEMDGFEQNAGIVVIGATNHEKVLDAALVRPGRFDRTVHVPLPDAAGRMEILKHYASQMKMHAEVNLSLLSQTTSGFSGADLRNLLNTAAIRASAAGKDSIDHDEVEYAYDKVLMGAERSFTQSAEAKANTAYHEAGHTIVLLHTPGAPDLHKVTILPRGRALGAMFHLPLNEHRIFTRQQLLAHLDVAMGGRVAEEFLNGKEQITSGASNDLEQATQRARAMVTQWGMGGDTGVFTLPTTDGRVNPAQVVAPETLKQLDAEVGALLKDSYERARRLIATHRGEWERLAQALLEHEVLDARQVMQAVRGEPVTRKEVHKFRPAADDDESNGTPHADKEEQPASTGGAKLPMPVQAKA